MLKIWSARATDTSFAEGVSVQPGEAAAVTKDAIYVATGNGLLKLREVQMESKKRMEVRDFLLGYPVKTGDRFRA